MSTLGPPLGAMASLIPRLFWVVIIVSMLFSLLPSPFQRRLLAVYNRGKLLQPSSSTKLIVPQKLFLHFYIVGTFFNGAILLISISYVYMRPRSLSGFNIEQTWEGMFILLLFEVHVMRRLYESMYVSKFSQHARMHILAYLFGLIYYVMAPLTLFPMALELILSSYTDFQHGFQIHETETKGENLWDLLSWHKWLGTAIFMWGSVHQYRCHCILASLRGTTITGKENRQYKIPSRDWFENVSCAHYLAEIVIYLGFVVLTGGSNLDVWLLFVYVVLNLSIAAVETHKWYRRTFKDYPPHRKAIIPYIC